QEGGASSSNDGNDDLDVATERNAIGNKTMVMVIRKKTSRNNDSQTVVLFAGEFPQPIEADRIVLQSEKQEEVLTDENDNMTTTTTTTLTVVHVRLHYTSNLASSRLLLEPTTALPSTTLKDINHAACGSCQLPLFLDDDTTKITTTNSKTPITKVLPLPQGHWDDIADYLICYPGQPVVDFTSAGITVESDVALQDANLLCLHPSNLQRSVCVLAVSNYGEKGGSGTSSSSSGSDNIGAAMAGSNDGVAADNTTTTTMDVDPNSDPKTDAMDVDPTYDPKEDAVAASSAAVRGDRLWRDSTGGDSVTLCCTQCCEPLGFCSLSSPDTWRFWKHRLAIVNNATTKVISSSNGPFRNLSASSSTPPAAPRRMASCASFLGREMVRYAESKAIFTFVVGTDDPNADDDKAEKNVLLLRLLSWETAMAWSEETITQEVSSQISPHQLDFRRVTKIIFEETADPTATPKTLSPEEFVMTQQWIWGGVDLCCPPGTVERHNPSTAGGISSIHRSTPTQQQQASQNTTASSVRIDLPKEDYEQVRADLICGRSLFSKSQEEATTLIKMGEARSGLGMTMIPL
ncbi:MAG: hypothetical protein SGARI_003036, partial [Bacillariaceae sp.]